MNAKTILGDLAAPSNVEPSTYSASGPRAPVVRNDQTRSRSASGLWIEMDNNSPVDVQYGASIVAQIALKRVFDLLVASLAIAFLLPLLLCVAIAIKVVDRGPVFFRQYREGVNGRLFLAFKFRTMRVDNCDLSGITQTEQNDPRVTSIGRFLRRTSIDELPQLLNVLFGEMSLVGPRPHVPGMLAGGMDYRKLVPYYDYRLKVRPGITGWAQANGLRGSTTNADIAKARIDHDVAYVQNISLALDILTIVKTLKSEFLFGNGH